MEELSASIRPTLVMAAMALLFATLLSIPLGVLSASRKGGLADRSIYLFGIICMSLPELLDRLHAPARLRGLYPRFQHYGSG